MIDREKLRAAVRKLGAEYVRYMLDEAIGLLPSTKIQKIAEKYVDVQRLMSDPKKPAGSSVLAEVKRFEKASLAGEYYESFAVNSRGAGGGGERSGS